MPCGEAGGMLTHSIPSYRLPRLSFATGRGLQQMGVEFVLGATIDRDALIGLNKDFDGTLLARAPGANKSLASTAGNTCSLDSSSC